MWSLFLSKSKVFVTKKIYISHFNFVQAILQKIQRLASENCLEIDSWTRSRITWDFFIESNDIIKFRFIIERNCHCVYKSKNLLHLISHCHIFCSDSNNQTKRFSMRNNFNNIWMLCWFSTTKDNFQTSFFFQFIQNMFDVFQFSMISFFGRRLITELTTKITERSN